MRDMWRYIHARTVVRVAARLRGPIPDRTAELQRFLRTHDRDRGRTFSILQVGAYDGVSNERVHDLLEPTITCAPCCWSRSRARFAELQKLWEGRPRVVPDSRGVVRLDRRAAAVHHRRRVQTPASVSGSGVVVLSIASGVGVQPICLAAISGLHHVDAGADDRLAHARAAIRALRFVAIDAEGYDAEILEQIDMGAAPRRSSSTSTSLLPRRVRNAANSSSASNGYSVRRVKSERHAGDAIRLPAF